jgi:hypothetical protein
MVTVWNVNFGWQRFVTSRHTSVTSCHYCKVTSRLHDSNVIFIVGQKAIPNFFRLHFVPGTPLEKKLKKIQVVPYTKYGGLFR